MRNSLDRQYPTEHWAAIGELRVRYLDWGGDGEPVTMMQGPSSSARRYELVASHLGHKCCLFADDARGHGQTTQAMDGYDWQTLATDGVGLMDHLGVSRVAVFGHSWGATVALNVAARFPDRLAAPGRIVGVDAAGRAIPRCRVRWIPETVHDIGYHKPGELAQVTDEFLSGLG